MPSGSIGGWAPVLRSEYAQYQRALEDACRTGILSGYRFTLTRLWAGLFPVPHGMVFGKFSAKHLRAKRTPPRVNAMRLRFRCSGEYIHDRTAHVSGDRFSGLDAVRADDRA